MSDERTTALLLLADDMAFFRRYLGDLLKETGYQVIEASDGAELLALLDEHEHRVSMVLSDVVMPKMNGIELAQRLRGEIDHLKILLVTGYSENQVALREAGDAYLQKPFAPQVLTKCLRDLLDGTAAVN